MPKIDEQYSYNFIDLLRELAGFRKGFFRLVLSLSPMSR